MKKATAEKLWEDSWKGVTGKTVSRSFWKVTVPLNNSGAQWHHSYQIVESTSHAGHQVDALVLEGSNWINLLDLRGEDLAEENKAELLLNRIALLMDWKLKFCSTTSPIADPAI